MYYILLYRQRRCERVATGARKGAAKALSAAHAPQSLFAPKGIYSGGGDVYTIL